MRTSVHLKLKVIFDYELENMILVINQFEQSATMPVEY